MARAAKIPCAKRQRGHERRARSCHTRRIGIPTIRDVSLKRGTLNVLVGSTLSGKASIMRPLRRPRQADQGSNAGGKDVTGIDVRQRSVAIAISRKMRGKSRYCAASAASLSVG
jgi:hypothetical protein